MKRQPYMVVDDWKGFDTPEMDYVRNSIEHNNIFKYCSSSSSHNDEQYMYLSHVVQPRLLTDHSIGAEQGLIPKPESPLYFPIVKSIVRFCDEHGIEYSDIGRISINGTIPGGEYGCTPHVDHRFPNQQLIFYLNDIDGDTIIYEKTQDDHSDNVVNTYDDIESVGDVVAKISPKKNRVLVFDGSHYHTNLKPTIGVRFIIVCTLINFIHTFEKEGE